MERRRIIRHGAMCGSSDRTRANCAYEVRRNHSERPKRHGANVRIKCFDKWIVISFDEYMRMKSSFEGWTNIEVCYTGIAAN